MMKLFKKIIMVGCVIAMLGTNLLSVNAHEDKTIDNSLLLPQYVPDEKVTLDSNGTPNWADNLIIAQCRAATAFPDGTFATSDIVLDHYAEMGVNCILFTPLSDRKGVGNGYTNLGLDTIDCTLTGKDDYEEGWQVFAEFVEKAHSRNIRIMIDIVSWGVYDDKVPQALEHPDWFLGMGKYGYHYDWSNEELIEWWINEAVEIAEKTNIDGFRLDMEPEVAGYEVGNRLRTQLHEKGRKLLLLTEVDNERAGVYDLEQYGVSSFETGNVQEYMRSFDINFYINNLNIVDAIKKGEYMGTEYARSFDESGQWHYYTFCTSMHDHGNYNTNNTALALGYQSICAPYIPFFFIGEEWGNSLEHVDGSRLFHTKIHWDELNEPANRQMYEQIKSYIRIRWEYKNILGSWAGNHREANICKVLTSGKSDLQAYARYKDNQAIIVVPNYCIQEEECEMKIYLPFDDMQMANYLHFTVKNAITGEEIISGDKETVSSFVQNIPYADMGVYVVTATESFVSVQDVDNSLKLDIILPGAITCGVLISVVTIFTIISFRKYKKKR